MSVAGLGWVLAAHVALALTTAAGFALRAAWMLAGRDDWLRRRWVRIAPHAIDTALLASGLTLALALGVNPVHQPWFAAKLTALVAYVASGALALGRARTRRARRVWLVVALVCLALVFASAITRRPLGLP